MAQLFWFLIWLLFAGWSTPVIPAATAPVPSLQESLVLPLSYGSSAKAADGALAITFDGVVEDSRCPADVMCAWSGMVVVALRVEAVGEQGQTVELGGFTDYDGFLLPQRPESDTTQSVEVGGYVVELLAVKPYPAKNDAPPAAADYEVELIVRRLNPDLQD